MATSPRQLYFTLTSHNYLVAGLGLLSVSVELEKPQGHLPWPPGLSSGGPASLCLFLENPFRLRWNGRDPTIATEANTFFLLLCFVYKKQRLSSADVMSILSPCVDVMSIFMSYINIKYLTSFCFVVFSDANKLPLVHHKPAHCDTYCDTAHQERDVIPVPSCWSFEGYNEVKRKKIKEQPMCAAFLDSHSQALLSLSDRPYMSSTLKKDILSLATCLRNYVEYLKRKRDTTIANHNSS